MTPPEPHTARAPDAHSTQPHSRTSSTLPHPPHPSQPTASRKAVSFCPFALLIGVAADGEVEQAMAAARAQQLGKRKMAMRAYSIEAPNLGEVAGKAWHSMVNGFAASLEPFLHHHQGSGVCSSSPIRSSSPERERETSPTPVVDRLQELDPSFFPNPPPRLTLKLPTLKRECSVPCSGAAKPILRRASVSVSPTDDSPPPFSPLAHAASSPPPSEPRLFPTLSRTTSQPVCPSHPQAGLIVPLASCCAQCEAATVYGRSAPEDGKDAYHEAWSPAAQKKRDEERKEREEHDRWMGEAEAIAKKYDADAGAEGREEKEAEEAEQEARGSRLARLAEGGGVDELSRARRDGRLPAASLAGSGDDHLDESAVGFVAVQENDHGDGLLASVITEEPSALEHDIDLDGVLDLIDAPLSSADSDGVSDRPSPLPAFEPSHTPLDRPPSSSATITRHDSPAPAPPPAAATGTSHSRPAPTPVAIPSKRRHSSARSPSLPSSSPPTTNHSLSFKDRVAALGSSLLQGANGFAGQSPGGAGLGARAVY
ncbi:hypothetical protein JCM10207_007746 [Rhodosporidiobolus poonsookiae]